MDLSYAAQHFDAILDMWYPGAQGGHAAARLLFGEVSPSGKLPVTFYQTLEELPDFTDYSMKDRTYRYMKNPAQYPFGYGLTYGNVQVRSAKMYQEENGIYIEAILENAGRMATWEVLQVYGKNQDSLLAPPNPVLCAFTRVFLEPGEQNVVRLSVPKRAFQVVDEDGQIRQEGKHFIFYVGCSQPDQRSRELTGNNPVEIDFLYEITR
jgi:beta-glucosidase